MVFDGLYGGPPFLAGITCLMTPVFFVPGLIDSMGSPPVDLMTMILVLVHYAEQGGAGFGRECEVSEGGGGGGMGGWR